MKVERATQKPAFVPITITLETEEEATDVAFIVRHRNEIYPVLLRERRGSDTYEMRETMAKIDKGLAGLI